MIRILLMTTVLMFLAALNIDAYFFADGGWWNLGAGLYCFVVSWILLDKNLEK